MNQPKEELKHENSVKRIIENYLEFLIYIKKKRDKYFPVHVYSRFMILPKILFPDIKYDFSWWNKSSHLPRSASCNKCIKLTFCCNFSILAENYFILSIHVQVYKHTHKFLISCYMYLKLKHLIAFLHSLVAWFSRLSLAFFHNLAMNPEQPFSSCHLCRTAQKSLSYALTESL